MDLSSSTMSPPRSLHAKRWALIKEGSSEVSSSQTSDNQSTNNHFSPRNNLANGGTGHLPLAIQTHDLSPSDDDTTIPSAVFSETFNVFTPPQHPQPPPKPVDSDTQSDEEEEEHEISTRSKDKNKKKMFRSPVQSAVKKSVNEVLFGSIGMDSDTGSIDGLFTKDPPEIRRISVCSEDLDTQPSNHSNGGLKRRNTTRPKGPGGEPFGGLRTTKDNNKCLIEIEGDAEMLEFVETTMAQPPHDKSALKMTTLNGFKSSLQQCGQSITDDDDDMSPPTPLMSSTFNNNPLEINVEAMDVEEGCSVEEGHRHGSFSSKDLPITRKDPPPSLPSMKKGQRNGAKRMIEVDRSTDVNYSGAKPPDVSYSDSEDMYSSDHQSSHGSLSDSDRRCTHSNRGNQEYDLPYFDTGFTHIGRRRSLSVGSRRRCSPRGRRATICTLDLNNSMLPPIHSHDVKKVVSSEEPDFVELERYFPSHHMKLFVGSWNMQSLKDVPNLVEEFLMPPETDTLQDIYVLGTQECSPHKRDWEVSVQATLGPTHVLVRSECLGDIHLMVLVRREMIWYMREIQSTTVACGPGGVMRNKGAVGIILTFFGTSLLFITSHLAAQTSKLKERNMDYLRIAQYMNFTKSIQRGNTDSLDITDKVDCTFWFGDLNYRVTAERDVVEDLIQQDMLEVLLNNDQLKTQMETSQAFNGFSEGHIQFPPTFKFDPGTENYDTSPKQRVPSWTDRILYKSQHDSITPLSYSHIPQLMVSDHRPVYGVFQVKLKPMLLSSTIHATGWFDKRAYARGMKRRRLVTEKPKDPSAAKTFKPQKSIVKKAAKVVNKPMKRVIESSKGGNSAPSNKKSFVCGIM